MFKKNIKTAFRNIIKDKFYSLINIIGLASGITIAIFILLFVNDEFSYDKHATQYERIYRLESDLTMAGKQDKFALTPFPLAVTMKDEIPEIKEVVRFLSAGLEDIVFKYEENVFYEDSAAFVDSTVFEIFDYKFIYGSPENSLNIPNTMVITASMANKYFGDDDPIGKMIEVTGFGDFEVKGVIEDLPANTHMKLNCMISVVSLVELSGGVTQFNDRSAVRFWGMQVYSYILLNENTNIEQVHNKFPEFYSKYMEEFGTRINASYNLLSTPVSETHFGDGSLQWDKPVGNKSYSIIFTFVAIFVIIIACINYMNMATARSSKRAREVGVKKVIGAHRGSLIRQFLGESALITIISLVFSIIMILLLLDTFNQLADKSILISSILSPSILIGILVIVIIVSFVSGSYPAFYLSAFVPQKVLKAAAGSSRKGWLRKILVVFQFSISLIMIIGTLVITKQQNFVKNTDLGFDQKNIIILPVRDSMISNSRNAFSEELLKNPSIEFVSASLITPTSTNQGKTLFNMEINGEMSDHTLGMSIIDFDYLNLMGMDIVSGRDFDRTIPTDSTQAFVVNEAMVKSIGLTNETAIGKRMRTFIGADGTYQKDGEIIGVVKDFHFGSLHNKIEPFVLLLINRPMPNIYVKYSGNDQLAIVNYITEARNKFNVSTPINFYDLEERIDSQYASEKKLGLLFTVFAILTIFISCLGLLGLSAFVTQQRTREIGVRKVLGSSNSQIIVLIAKSFIFLVGIAILISIVPSYLVMEQWLQDFEYRTEIGVLPFLIGSALAIIISIITVSFHAFRASILNPAESLKYE
ncbi:ABC transporter permease [Bacteroidota bacterium]